MAKRKPRPTKQVTIDVLPVASKRARPAKKKPRDRATRMGVPGWEVCYTRSGATMVLSIWTGEGEDGDERAELCARRDADGLRELPQYDGGRVTVRSRGQES